VKLTEPVAVERFEVEPLGCTAIHSGVNGGIEEPLATGSKYDPTTGVQPTPGVKAGE
jgi:hypothetical protein